MDNVAIERQQQSDTVGLQHNNIRLETVNEQEIQSEQLNLVKTSIIEAEDNNQINEQNYGKDQEQEQDHNDINKQYIKEYDLMVENMVQTDQYRQRQEVITKLDQQLISQLGVQQVSKADASEFIHRDVLNILDRESYLQNIQTNYLKLKYYLIVQMNKLYINKVQIFKQELMLIMSQDDSLICNLLVIFVLRNKNIDQEIFCQFIVIFQKMFQIVAAKNVDKLLDKYGLNDSILDLIQSKSKELIIKGLCDFILETRICQLSNVIFRNVRIKYLVTIIMSDTNMLALRNMIFCNQICKFLEKDSSDEEFEYLNEISNNLDSMKKKFEQDQVGEYIDYLIEKQYQYILSFILKAQSSDFVLSSKQIINLIESGQFHFMQQFIQQDSSTFYYLLKDPSNKIFELLMKDERNNSHFLFQLRILFQIVRKYKQLFQEDAFIMILKKYSRLINNKNEINNAFFDSLYIYCLISLILKKLCGKWHRYNYYFEDLSQQYLEYAEQLVKSVDDDSAFQLTLFQKHNQFQFTLVELLFQDKVFFGSIINLPQFQRVVSQKWLGNNKTNSNPFSYLFSYQFYYEEDSIKQFRQASSIIYNQNITKSIRKQTMRRLSYSQIGELNTGWQNWVDKISNKLLSDKSIFKYLKTVPQELQYQFQFEIYLSNLSVRKVIDTSVFLAIVISIMINFQSIVRNLFLLNHYWDTAYIEMFMPQVPSVYAANITMDASKTAQYRSFRDQVIQSSQYRQNFQQICDQLINQVFIFKSTNRKSEFSSFCYGIEHYNKFVLSDLDNFTIMMFLLLVDGFNWVFKMFYQYLIHHKIYFTLDYLVDTLLMVACGFQINNNFKLKRDIEPSVHYIYYYRSLTINLSLITILVFTKLISQLSIIKTFGIYVKAINQIFARLSLFLFYYIALVILATLVFYNLFHGIKGSGYDDLINTFLSVFSQPLGNFNIIDTQGLVGYKLWLVNVQNIVGLTYAFFMSTFLLNIIIAILSNVYEEINDTSQQQYSEILYIDYLQNMPNIYYDCCENIPFALRIISILIYPFLIMKKNKKLNRKINYIIYIFKFLIPFYLVSIVYNILMLPFVYFKFIKMILQNRYCDQDYFLIDVDRKTKVRHLIEFTCLGPFYLFFRFFTSDTLFIIENMNNPTIKYFRYLFDREIYIALKNTVFEYIHQKQYYACHAEFSKKLYQNLIRIKNDYQLARNFLAVIKNRLQVFASQSENELIPILQIAQVINQMKNKNQNIEEEHRIENKTKALEIFFARYSINQNKYSK